MTAPVRLFHVSDVHFGVEDKSALQWFADAVHAERPDAVICTGDLTQRATHAQFDAARTFFQSLKQADHKHGGAFHYVSPNTDMLAWVLERLSGARYSDLLSELLWQKIGAEEDGYITVDRMGAPRGAGGRRPCWLEVLP